MPDESDDPRDDDTEDLDDFERVFVIGGRPSGTFTPDELAQRRRTKQVALIALGTAVVIVAVSITLVALLINPSPAPSSPAAAAREWALDLVRGDSAAQRALQCADDAVKGDELRHFLVSARDARVGIATLISPSHWLVPVTFIGVSGASELRSEVDVIRRDGRYLVC